MSFLTYLTKTLFFVRSFMEMIGKVWQSRFFSFLYIKSKTAFKPSFRTLSKLAEQLKIRVRRGLKKGLYYEINFIFIIFKKLLCHQPGTQKSGAGYSCVFFDFEYLEMIPIVVLSSAPR